jgi:hypothetical protein
MPETPETLQCIESNKTALRADLEECLTIIASQGTFAFFEGFDVAPNPGIQLNNGGIVGLPLSDRDAQSIVMASHKAPYGKGERTIMDDSVRKTWEISRADFTITNPAWQRFIHSVARKVSASLGINVAGKGVSAELYKILLYDKGTMFKPHQEYVATFHQLKAVLIGTPQLGEST